MKEWMTPLSNINLIIDKAAATIRLLVQIWLLVHTTFTGSCPPSISTPVRSFYTTAKYKYQLQRPSTTGTTTNTNIHKREYYGTNTKASSTMGNTMSRNNTTTFQPLSSYNQWHSSLSLWWLTLPITAKSRGSMVYIYYWLFRIYLWMRCNPRGPI